MMIRLSLCGLVVEVLVGLGQTLLDSVYVYADMAPWGQVVHDAIRLAGECEH